MYVCVYACMHACMHVRMYTNLTCPMGQEAEGNDEGMQADDIRDMTHNDEGMQAGHA